jgi:phosphopantetheinyl transferase (holo-ACP synthase)
MQRVKLFRGRSIGTLEEEINDWIQRENVRVINVSISEDEAGLTAALLVES